ncbi:MAG: hypothetical protein ACMXYC_02675 [Candidatus Woesearchaeota archaeon]
MNKKAAFAMQIHWVFVLIAGGIILLFFITVITSYRGTADTKIAVDMLQNMDTLFAGAQASDNTLSTVDMPPQVEVIVTCDVSSQIAIGGTSASRNVEQLLVFSRSELSARQLTFFTRMLRMPFIVGNVLYAAESNMRFYVPTSKVDDFVGIIPEQFMIVTYDDINHIRIDGTTAIVVDDHTVMNDIGTDEQLVRAMRRHDVRVIRYQGSIHEGSAHIHRSRRGERNLQDTGNMEYNNHMLFMGILFSESAEFYECMQKKIIEQVGIQQRLLQKRLDIYINGIDGELAVSDQFCKTQYEQASTLLNNNPLSVQQQAQLQQYNRQINTRSCPSIY